jgi:hypothetical protein
MNYAREYITSAMSAHRLEPPDKRRANGEYEILSSLYEAHCVGGASSVKNVWTVLVKHNPALENLIFETKIIHADDLKNLSPPEYLMPEYGIYTRGFNVLVGPSGGGKSFVALDIACKTAQTNGAVLYIAGEGIYGYNARWEAWKRHNNVISAPVFFYPEAVQIMDTHTLAAFIAEISDHKPVLVIVDTLARSAVGLEENSARDMGIFVHALDTIRNSLNCAVLVVHHSGKDGRIRGSSALYAAADCVLALTNSDGLITLRNDGDGGGKNKHAPPLPLRSLRLVPMADGAVLMDATTVIQTENDQITPNQQNILSLLENEPLTAKDLAAATDTPISSIYKTLKRLTTAGAVTRGVDGRYSLQSEGMF